MSRKSRSSSGFNRGSWRAVDQVSGFTERSDKLVENWDGKMTLPRYVTDVPVNQVTVEPEPPEELPFISPRIKGSMESGDPNGGWYSYNDVKYALPFGYTPASLNPALVALVDRESPIWDTMNVTWNETTQQWVSTHWNENMIAPQSTITATFGTSIAPSADIEEIDP